MGLKASVKAKFVEMGRQAFDADMPAAPILNAEVAKTVNTLEVGQGAVWYFKAYSEGYEKRRNEKMLGLDTDSVRA